MDREAKVAVRAQAQYALRKGRLTAAPCEACGDENVEMHHDDYERPLDVRWLCRKHHLALHPPPPSNAELGRPVNVRLPEDLYEALRVRAEAEERTISQQIRHGLRVYMGDIEA